MLHHAVIFSLSLSISLPYQKGSQCCGKSWRTSSEEWHDQQDLYPIEQKRAVLHASALATCYPWHREAILSCENLFYSLILPDLAEQLSAHGFTYTWFNDVGWMCMDSSSLRTGQRTSTHLTEATESKCLFTTTASVIWTQPKCIKVPPSQLVLPSHPSLSFLSLDWSMTGMRNDVHYMGFITHLAGYLVDFGEREVVRCWENKACTSK